MAEMKEQLQQEGRDSDSAAENVGSVFQLSGNRKRAFGKLSRTLRLVFLEN